MRACRALPGSAWTGSSQRLAAKSSSLTKPRVRATATLGFFRDQRQQKSRLEQAPNQAPAQQLPGAGEPSGVVERLAADEELQRHVEQLEADNAELHAEIQHLAATLRAALASSPDGPALERWDPEGGDPGQDCCHHTHDHLSHLCNGSSNGCSSGGTIDGWQGTAGSLDSATGSMLSSMDSSAAGGASLPPHSVAAPQYHQPTSVSQATLSCSMQHPGSICCSKLSSTMEPGGAACTVSLHTTARCTADDATVHRHLSPAELQTLASHALVSAAHSFSQAATAHYRTSAAPQQDIASKHDDLCRVLEHGVVICAERTPPSQFGHKSYLLTLQDPQTAMRVRAIYKPRVYGDACGWHRTPMEWVAYRLNLLLGLDYVPPTAYRSAPLTLSIGDEEEDLVFSEGAMMLWVENAHLLKEFAPQQWGMDPALLLSDTRILDVLLHNSDRHHGHFLLGPHWAQGQHVEGNWQGVMRPVLIDHAASFRKEAVVSMEHENAFGSGPVRCISASTYLRLRFLDAHTVAQELGQHLSRSEQRQLLHRRDYVLHYFDELVATQGYAGTVRE